MMLDLIPIRDTTSFERPVWIIIPGDGYMYGPTPSLWRLLWEVLSGWRCERNIVG